jgi:DNA-binding MarR family transcriptional regulator
MTKLSDTQSIILSAAAQRPDGNVLPLPGSLRGGAVTKVVGALLTRGLIREHIVDSPRKADPALNTVWRNLEDGRGVLLFITAAGADAIGVEPEAAVAYRFNEGTNSAGEPAAGTAPTGADAAPVEVPAKRRGRPKKAAPTGSDTGAPPKARGDTKQAQLIAMLRRKEGATIAQIVEATGWQPHYADARTMPR